MPYAPKTKAAVVVGVLAAVCPCAFALNPFLDVSQYAHKTWTIHEGFFKGVINSITQSGDGYLWLGTEFGLLRFDGVRADEWAPPGPERLPSNYIRSLLTARDGTVWIGTATGLASWNGIKLSRYRELEARTVWSILEDHDGTIWVGSSQAGSNGWLCAIRAGKTECHGRDGSFGRGILSLYEDAAGNLWVGASSGVWRWKPGPPKRYVVPEEGLRSLVHGDHGELLIGANSGLFELVGGEVRPYRIDTAPAPRFGRLFRDRDGALWIGTYGQGLIHFHAGRTDVFSRADGLSADEILSLWEDREGNIWVATGEGLDRFREMPVVTVSAKQGLSTDDVFAVLAAKDGSVWLAGNNGLDRWKNGQVTKFRKSDGLPDDRTGSLSEGEDGRIWVSSDNRLAWFDGSRFVAGQGITGGAQMSAEPGHLWVSDGQGLLHLMDGHLVEEFKWSRFEHVGRAMALAADSQGAGVWLGYYHGGGVDYFKDGQIRRSYTHDNGLGEGDVSDLQLDSDGKLWVSTQGGLSVLEKGRIATLSSQNGLPCDTVYWRMEADDHSNWLYMPCGLVRIDRAELDIWMANPKRKVQTIVFDGTEGVKLHSVLHTSYTPHVDKSLDGKLWFTAGGGVSVIDPRHLPVNKLPPPVHIESIKADRKDYDVKRGMRLPALSRDLQIDYTALSLVAPEKVRFKYKLEGYDRDWQDAGTRRQAFYDNLGPRKYRFRVIACNNSGVWNEAGDTLDFSIAPAYYQTTWFKAVFLAAFLLFLWGLYLLRVQQLRRDLKKLQDVIETIPAMAWTALPDGTKVVVNRRWSEYTGVSEEDPAGTGWTVSIHPDDLQGYREKWRAALATGESFECDARFRHAATGEYRWFNRRAVAMRDGGGKILRWCGVIADIEDRKRADEQREKLRQMEDELRHSNRLSTMGALVASLAHDINQPITAVITSAKAGMRWLDRDPPVWERVRAAIARIEKDGERAGATIARVRAFYKKGGPPKPELLDVNEVAREMMDLLHGEATKYSVSMRTELDEALPKVLADHVQLQQVFMNLMLNAIEAMKETAGELVIRSQLTQDGEVQITVSDTGVGLPAENVEKIFSAFFTTKEQGTGMGLAISRSIIESHGGRLWATPNDRRGASFHFTLPVKSEAGA